MSPQALYISLLRPPVLHILRAAGFHGIKPAALDTIVDLAARYMNSIASKTAEYAWSNHNDPAPTVTDIRMALQDVGALRPELGDMEEQLYYDDDMRGVQAFLDWIKGDANREIMRIAGLVGPAGEVSIDPTMEREDFLAALKKKHSKTGEESRFQGTILGKDLDEKAVQIDGGNADSIEAWELSLREQTPLSQPTPGSHMSTVSSPLSEV